MESFKMTRFRGFTRLASMFAVGAAILLIPARAYAHCDTMDGPVVKAAQQALAVGKVTPVLMWVPVEDEAEVRNVFLQTLEVRKLGSEAAAVADRHFLETVVRIHRLDEGEPYTGLKPAGTDLGHAVPAADRALSNGSVAELRQVLTAAFDARLDEYFADAVKKSAFSADDTTTGREFVQAYVRLMHFSEEMEALTSAHGHASMPSAQPVLHHPK